MVARLTVAVCDPRVLLLDGLEEDAGVLEACIGRVATLSLVAHTRAVGAAGVAVLAVCPAGVPRQAHKHGADRAVVVGLLLEDALLPASTRQHWRDSREKKEWQDSPQCPFGPLQRGEERRGHVSATDWHGGGQLTRAAYSPSKSPGFDMVATTVAKERGKG